MRGWGLRRGGFTHQGSARPPGRLLLSAHSDHCLQSAAPALQLEVWDSAQRRLPCHSTACVPLSPGPRAARQRAFWGVTAAGCCNQRRSTVPTTSQGCFASVPAALAASTSNLLGTPSASEAGHPEQPDTQQQSCPSCAREARPAAAAVVWYMGAHCTLHSTFTQIACCAHGGDALLGGRRTTSLHEATAALNCALLSLNSHAPLSMRGSWTVFPARSRGGSSLALLAPPAGPPPRQHKDIQCNANKVWGYQGISPGPQSSCGPQIIMG